MKLCFLHGLGSSPQWTKAIMLRGHDPQFWIPTLPPDIYGRVALLERESHEPMLVVGSSMGGLTALLFAMRHPETVKGILLLAPAVGSYGRNLFSGEEEKVMASTYIPRATPTVIIAGVRDALIPLSSIHALIKRSPDPERIQLLEVDDDHDLHQSFDLMIRTIEQIRTKILI